MNTSKEARDFDYYPERYQVYPYVMLGNLSKAAFKKEQAQKYFEIAMGRTKSSNQKEKLKKLLV